MQLHSKKKVEIIVDAAARERVTRIVERAGAKGYSIVNKVQGRGPRGIRGSHDIFDEARNVLIIVVASAEVAQRILDSVLPFLETTAGVAYVSDVSVARDDHF
jgi:nitrogen regulatory protein PII